MSIDLFRLIYCSRYALPPEGAAAELDRILLASRANNLRDGVTGALLYSGGMFAQLLEGPFGAVQRTFERIQTDERHDDVVLLSGESVASRIFSQWTMALAEPPDPERAKAVLAQALTDAKAEGSLRILHLLASVVRGGQEHETAYA